jgi:hypothetical protein
VVATTIKENSHEEKIFYDEYKIFANDIKKSNQGCFFHENVFRTMKRKSCVVLRQDFKEIMKVTIESPETRENNMEDAESSDNQAERIAKPKECLFGKIEQTQG